MALENATHIDELVASSPLSTDDPFGANAIYLELQQLKTVLTTDFANVSGAVTTSDVEMNYLDVTTLGTTEDSKAVVQDASGNINAAATTWTNLGEVTTVDVNGGSIDGVTIGAAAAPTVTDLGSVATCDINGGTIDGVTIGGAAAPTVTNLGSVATCDINGGSIDGVTIGAASAPTVTDLGSVATCDINGGAIDATTIGGATPAAGTFTTAKATSQLGYATGAGGTITQAGSRTAGVTINNACGAITLVSAAGSASWQSFVVSNSVVAATDVIAINQASGTDLYLIHVTDVSAGSFEVTFATTAGTTTEQPVFNFAVIKGVTS